MSKGTLLSIGSLVGFRCHHDVLAEGLVNLSICFIILLSVKVCVFSKTLLSASDARTFPTIAQ